VVWGSVGIVPHPNPQDYRVSYLAIHSIGVDSV
jgi:hypothetical protein